MLQVLQQLTWTITATRARATNGCLADPLLALQDPRQRTAPPRSSLPGAAFLSAAMCLRAVTRTPRPPVTPASRRSQPRGPPPRAWARPHASRLTAGHGRSAQAPFPRPSDRKRACSPALPRSSPGGLALVDGAATTGSHSRGGPRDQQQPASTRGLLAAPRVGLAGGTSLASVQPSDVAAPSTPCRQPGRDPGAGTPPSPARDPPWGCGAVSAPALGSCLPW